MPIGEAERRNQMNQRIHSYGDLVKYFCTENVVLVGIRIHVPLEVVGFALESLQRSG